MTLHDTTVSDALADIRSALPDDMLAALAGYDGSATILIPNFTENYDLTQTYEGPQTIAFQGTRLQAFPTRIAWNLRVASTSMRHTDATTKAGRRDWNMVLVGSRKCDVYVGNSWVDDATFFAMLIKAATPNDQRPLQQIITSLQQRGLSLNSEMPMYLQHLGADEERFMGEIVPLFQHLGGHDNTAQVRNQTQGQARSVTVKSVRLEGNNVRVRSFEIGTADRSRSQNGAGFIGFLDASYTTVASIVEADRAIAANNAVLEDPKADEQDRGVAYSRHAELTAYWGSGSTRTRRPFHNWGGTTRVANPDGAVRFYPTPVPCGRLVIADQNGREYPINVWVNSQGSTNSPAMAAGTEATQTFEPVIPTGAITEPF